jgi:hypothetical protein
MSFSKPFTQVFEDKRWPTKILVGGILAALSFLIIPGLLVGGYMIEYARKVARGLGPDLPEWNDWGDKFTKGILSWLINLVYFLPVILLSVCLSVFNAIAGEGSDTEAIRAMASICLGVPSAVYGLFAAFVVPAARVRYAVSNDLGSAFQFGEVFSLISRSLSNYVIFIVITIAAGLAAFLAVLVTLPLCGIGLILIPFASFWSHAVWANALGQFYATQSPGAGPGLPVIEPPEVPETPPAIEAPEVFEAPPAVEAPEGPQTPPAIDAPEMFEAPPAVEPPPAEPKDQ